MSELLNESGAYENLSDTFRNWFSMSFNHDSKVIFLSEGGFEVRNNNATTREGELKTTNDLKIFEKEQAVFVKFSLGDFETLESWNDGVYGSQTIYVDIFGKHRATEMETVRQKLDKQLFEAADLGKIRKKNNGYSQFTGFLIYSIDWERIHENLEHGIVEQIAGELRVSVQRGKI